MNKQEAVKFVASWQGNTSIADVARETGLPLVKVASTARALRKKGVPLKPYGKSTASLTQLEWEELIAMCAPAESTTEDKAHRK
jgi:hypothetical protein